MDGLGWAKLLGKSHSSSRRSCMDFLASPAQVFLERCEKDVLATLMSWGSVSQRRPGRLSRNRALQESWCWALGLALHWSLAGWRARWKNRLKKWSRRETFSTWQKALDKHELRVRITLRNLQLVSITFSATQVSLQHDVTLGCIFNMKKSLDWYPGSTYK